MRIRLPRSLLLLKNSLLFEIFSLLIFIGNCLKSGCSTVGSCSEIRSQRPETAKFPLKFPVSREFAWRLVRIPLRRQPASPEVGEPARDSWRKARQWRAFAIRLAVSRLPILGNTRPIRRASPATTAKIPVFRRQRPETGFDPHWRGGSSLWLSFL